MQPQFKREILIERDQMLSKYKQTALIAAEVMPSSCSLKESSEFVLHKLKKEHPELAWGVLLSKKSTAKYEETTFMKMEDDACENYLTFEFDYYLHFTIFAWKRAQDTEESNHT